MQKHIPSLCLVTSLAALTACGGNIVVQPAAPSSSLAAKISGRYAVFLDSGRWRLDTKRSGGDACPFYSVTFEVDRAFDESARSFMLGAVESVDYVSQAISRQTLLEKGYTAQIILREGPVSLRANRGGYGIVSESSVAIDALIVWADADSPYTFQVSGSATEIRRPPLDCGLLGEATALSLQSALHRAMEQSMAKIGDGIAAHGY